MSKLHRGLGIKDLDYQTSKYEKVGPDKWKQIWRCPYYNRWDKLMERLGPNNKNKAYFDKSCCQEWIYFSGFKGWMGGQFWEGLHLDKDILVPTNKVYSPDTCCFVPGWLNTLVLTNPGRKGEQPLGVSLSSKGQFRAQVSKIETNTNFHLGLFSTPQEAHGAWQLGKASQILLAVDLYRKEDYFRKDVAAALYGRVEKLKHENSMGIETTFL